MAHMDAPRNWGVSRTGSFGLKADVRQNSMNARNADIAAIRIHNSKDRSQPKANVKLVSICR